MHPSKLGGLHLTLLSLVLALTATLGMAATGAAATSASDRFNDLPVRGTYGSSGGRFIGTADVLNFRNVGGELFAVADLSGRLQRANGTIRGRVTDVRVLLPLEIAGQAATSSNALLAASCQVLHLTLGALDLDLLGVNVHLNRIVLVITAEPGPGNLLGNLLCAITGLLDGGPALNDTLVLLLRVVRQLVNIFCP